MTYSTTINYIAERMSFAFMAEAVSWPTPGLVDPIDTGSHKDMDVLTLLRSSASLSKYFFKAALLGADSSHCPDNSSLLFSSLRKIGLNAEKDMFDATFEINTHKGALFHALLLCAAAGISHKRHNNFLPENVCEIAKGISFVPLEQDILESKNLNYNVRTTGLRAFNELGLLGVRGEAMSGYNTVLKYGLPAFKESIRKNNNVMFSIVHTLLILMANLQDTTLLNRDFDIRNITYVQKSARVVIKHGDVFTDRGKYYLNKFNEKLIKKNISPGGSADLTIMALALFLWENDWKKNEAHIRS